MPMLLFENPMVMANGTPAMTIDEKSMLLLAYSNRAEDWMKRKMYDQPLKDSDAALSVDPSHVKSLFRKGRAQLEPGRSEHACSCFEKVLSLSPDDLSVRALLDRSKQSMAKCLPDVQLHGYSGYLLGISNDPPPILADYIGPVVVKATRNKIHY
jgi:tetratricopeptide (TPR) repeat protein